MLTSAARLNRTEQTALPADSTVTQIRTRQETPRKVLCPIERICNTRCTNHPKRHAPLQNRCTLRDPPNLSECEINIRVCIPMSTFKVNVRVLDKICGLCEMACLLPVGNLPRTRNLCMTLIHPGCLLFSPYFLRPPIT